MADLKNEFNFNLLINVSNHPHTGWGEDQRKCAEKIVDIPFPQVDPSPDTNLLLLAYTDVVARCREIIREYKEQPDDDSIIAVHVMGEQGLTHAIVNALQEYGIPAVHSCTERIVQETESGEKISRFKFRGFRYYVVFNTERTQ